MENAFSETLFYHPIPSFPRTVSLSLLVVYTGFGLLRGAKPWNICSLGAVLMLSDRQRKELLEYSYFQKPSRRLKLPQSVHLSPCILSNPRDIALKSLKKRKLAARWETLQTWHHVSWRLTSLAVSMLVNYMHPGPFSGTEVNWHNTSSIRTTKLSWSPKTGPICKMSLENSPWLVVAFSPHPGAVWESAGWSWPQPCQGSSRNWRRDANSSVPGTI